MISLGIVVSSALAAAETAFTQQDKISPALMFAGITKLEDVPDIRAVNSLGFDVPGDYLPIYQEECRLVLSIFDELNVSARKLRRTIRTKLGMGGVDHNNNEAISRDDVTRASFDRAEAFSAELKVEHTSVTHLLYCLLETNDKALFEALSDYQIDIEQLKTLAMQCDTSKLMAMIEAYSNDKSGTVRSTTNSNEQNILSKLGKDLVQAARDGELWPVIGREDELKQIWATLRTTSTNVILTGEAGVGKTSLVEGLAYLIAEGRVPAFLRDKKIIQIDAASLVGGTNYRGDFEARMQELIRTTEATPEAIIFIDEVHMLVGAGGSSQSNLDAANILKPALNRGRLRMIGATTEKEYRRYVTPDAALARRFIVVPVREPSREDTYQILMQAKGRLQTTHHVIITDEAVKAAVELSDKYMPEQRFPAKAFNLLDAAAARIGIDEWISRDIDFEQEQGSEESSPLYVEAIHIQKAMPQDVNISGGVTKRELLGLEDRLNAQVIGQTAAARAITEAIQLNYVDLETRKRPVGVFLFVGPTGVGKTEMARATADCLFGSPDSMIRIDMSEFMNKHSVSRLIGAEPGYIGYDQGGQLTGALAARPQSVVLLDEIEKAHRDVLNIFLQVFDAGRLTDGAGHTVDASRAMFIMTSNIGIMPGGLIPSKEMLDQQIRIAFSPEFYNRIDEVIIFNPLNATDMEKIVHLQLRGIKEKLAQKGLKLVVFPEAIKELAKQGNDPTLGARPLLRLIQRKISAPIAQMQIREDLFPGQEIIVNYDGVEIKIDVNSDGTI